MLSGLDLRKMPELVSETYTHACRRAIDDIQKYESSGSNIPQQQVAISKEKLAEAQKVIGSTISQAERSISDGCDGMEMVMNWLSLLQSQSEFMEEVASSEKSQIGQFMLSFTSTSNKLKTLKTDVPEFLRKLIENEETPATIRLAQLWSKMDREYHTRCGILNDVDNQAHIALQRLRKVTAENDSLTAENKHYDEQLETFSNEESYQMIQNARRHDLLLEEWTKKRENIIDQTEKAEEELKHFLDKENGEATITKQCSQCDQEYEKLRSKYEDLMREVREEGAVSSQNAETILRALEQELASARSQQLSKEKSITRNAVRKAKISGERKVQRHRAEASSTVASLRQALKKAGEEKSKPKRSRNKKIQEPEVDPQQVMLEKGFHALETNHETTTTRIRRVFDEEIQELEKILEAYVGSGNLGTDREIEIIQRAHSKAVDLAQANIARVKQRCAERNLELSAVTSKVVTMQGLVDDYLKQWKVLNEEHARLMKMTTAVSLETEEAKAIQREIERMDTFVEKAVYIIESLKKRLSFRLGRETFSYLPKRLKKWKSESDLNLQKEIDLSVRQATVEEPVKEEESVHEPTPVEVTSVSDTLPEEEQEHEEEIQEVVERQAPVVEVIEEEPQPPEPPEEEEEEVFEFNIDDTRPMRRFRVVLDRFEKSQPIRSPRRIRTAHPPPRRSKPPTIEDNRRFSARYVVAPPKVTRKAATLQTWGVAPRHESILFAVTPFGNGDVEDEVYIVDRQMKLSQARNPMNAATKKRFIMKTPDFEEDTWLGTNRGRMSLKQNMNHIAEWIPTTRVRRCPSSRRSDDGASSKGRTYGDIDSLLYSHRKLPRI